MRCVEGNVCTTFILVRELEWIKYIFNVIIQFSDHKVFETLHDNLGDSHWSVIIIFFRASLFMDWGDIGRFPYECSLRVYWKLKQRTPGRNMLFRTNLQE